MSAIICQCLYLRYNNMCKARVLKLICSANTVLMMASKLQACVGSATDKRWHTRSSAWAPSRRTTWGSSTLRLQLLGDPVMLQYWLMFDLCVSERVQSAIVFACFWVRVLLGKRQKPRIGMKMP